MDGKRIILAAHRGDRYKAPENTMAAFESAIKFGVDMIETDIRETLDGELVIIHDRSAFRTAGVDRKIDEMTLSEVKSLDVGYLFSEEFRGERIPTVKEFIDYMKGNDVLINWELKVYPSDFGDARASAVCDKLIGMIEESGMGERSMINSFSSRTLEYVYGKYGNKYPLHGQGIHNCRKSEDDPTLPEKDIFDWCCLYPHVKGKLAIDYPENFEYCNENGVIPCICIPDKEEDYKRAVDLGCKMFTSNNIYAAAEILKNLGAR